MSFFSRLGNFAKSVVGFEKSHLNQLFDAVKNDPKRLVLGVDPGSTKAWNLALGRNDEPLVNWLGGPTESRYDIAESQGIDTGPGRLLHEIASVIAGAYGGAGAAKALGGLGGGGSAAGTTGTTAAGLPTGAGISAAPLTGGTGALGGAGGAGVFGGMTWADIGLQGGQALLNLFGAKKSSDQLAGSADAALRAVTQANEQARTDLQPFREAGGAAINPLLEYLKTPIDDSVQRENIVRDVSNTAAARGKLGSGGTLLELARQLYGMQQQNRGQRFNELFNVATLGANAGARQATNTLNSGALGADLITGGGSARAAGTVGATNTLNDLLNNFIFLRAARNGT